MTDLKAEAATAVQAEKSKLTQWLASRPYRTLLIGVAVGIVAILVLQHFV